ncbi:hypothetical protein CMO83_02645 [Candidatus Woesearchaeota archaeon]|nr:hypothetical protein [Candidatus Woesearchaeota archaeon]
MGSDSYSALQFVPVLVLLVLWYCMSKAQDNSYATWSAYFIVLIFVISVIPAFADTSQSALFEPKKGADYKDFFGQFGDSIRDIIEGRLDIATAGLYRGNVEQNQYESLGVYFGNLRAADPRFYTDDPITVWGTIRSKTYQDAVIVNFSCYRWKDNTKKIYADKIVPNFKFPIFTLEEVDTECTFFPSLEKSKDIKPGPNIITFAAEYNFGTDAYLKSYFIDRDRFRANARENIDPLSQFGIKDKNPVAVFTNGPVEIGLGTGESLITVSEGYAVKPSIDITLTNRQEIKDKDKNIITRWEGKIKNITELILLVPPGIEISNLDKCKEKDIEEKIKCPCSMPFKEYDETKCKKTCEDLLFECNTACVDSYIKTDPGDVPGRLSCVNECKTSNEKCNSECDFLFKPTGEENLQGDYKGYALDVGSLEFRDLNKDIDKHRSFRCRFDPSPGVLDDTPITTKYFRVRAKYNYLIENSVQINVEQSLVSPGTAPESLIRTALDRGFDDPDLLYAIAYVESGLRHCCQSYYGGPGTTCNPSDQKRCSGSGIISSGSSIGIMQVRYYAQDPDLQRRIQEEVKTRERKVCDSDQTIFDFDCNVELGIDILKEKYNDYKNGCTSTYIWRNRDDSEVKRTYPTFLDGCGNGVTSSGVRYDSYREWDAAVRGYNGWGRSSNFDVDYVEKVLNTYEQIKNGQIQDENQIRDYFASRTGSGMISDDSLDQDIQPTTQTSTITEVTGTYDQNNKEVTISWPKSEFAGVTDYQVIRSISNTGHDIICNVNSDNRNEYSCTNKIQPNEVSLIITYEVLSNAPNQQYTEGRTDVSTY